MDTTATPRDTASFVGAAEAQSDVGTGLHLAIRDGGTLAGVIGYRRSEPPANLDIGYWLGDGFEGRGLMTMACRALVTHVFAAAAAHRVQIRAAAGNVRSRAVAERLGFRLEGVLREAEHLPDGWVDHCVYGMLARDWVQLRGLRSGFSSSPDPEVPGRLCTHQPGHAQGRIASACADDAAIDGEMAAYFEAQAPEYDDWYERRGRYANPQTDAAWFDELARLHAVVRAFRLSLPGGASVLDVGCGTGRWTAVLAEPTPFAAAGLDRSSAMLAEAQGRIARLGLRALLVRGDALDLPFPAAAFAAALSGFVFEHLSADHRSRFFAELRRVVRPGGRVLILEGRRGAGHTSDVEIQSRLLRDGRHFRVRQTLFTAAGLCQALSPLGPATTGETANFFVWAEVIL